MVTGRIAAGTVGSRAHGAVRLTVRHPGACTTARDPGESRVAMCAAGLQPGGATAKIPPHHAPVQRMSRRLLILVAPLLLRLQRVVSSWPDILFAVRDGEGP